jgi:hypothetical protein
MRPTRSTALILPPCLLLLLGLTVWLLPRPVSEAANNTNPCTSKWSAWSWVSGPPTLTSTVSPYKAKVALQIPRVGDDTLDLPTPVSVGITVTANSADQTRTDTGCGGSETETVTPSPQTTWTVSGGDAVPTSGSGTTASFDVKSPGSVTVTFSTVDTTGQAASVSSSATLEILRIPRLRFSGYVPEERLSKLPPIYVNHFDANNNERWDSLESGTPDPRALTAVELSVESVSGFTAAATVLPPATGVKLWADPQKTKLFAPAKVGLGETKTFYVEGLQRTNSNDALEFQANWTEGEFSYSTRGKTGVWEVDVDVDSRNTKGFGAPAPDDQAEDEVEFSAKSVFPGKVVVINTKFADGLDLSGAGTASPQLVPMVLRLMPLRNAANATFQLDYRASRPGLSPDGDIVDKGAAAGSDRYSLSAGGMRIWKSAGRNPKKITEGGDYIPSGEEIAWDRLGSGDTATVYVEYVDNSPASAGGKSEVTFTAKETGAALDGKTDVSSTDSVNMFLLPFEIEGHKRGTIAAPGAVVPKGTGEYGQETVMMENADSDDNTSQPDYATASVNKSEDDDFVKVVLRWPKDMKLQGAKLELKHTGLNVDPTKTADAEKYKEFGASKLNFYKPDGTKLNDEDLVVENLGSPGNSYLAQILADGELTLFVEGAENFGYAGSVANNQKNLGGAMLKYELAYNGSTTRQRLLVYRGGFFKYRQPTGAPGAIGTLEFWDGKGRIKHATAGKGREFQTDEWDQGRILASWQARSGKMTDGSQGSPGPGLDYDITEARAGRLPCGHLPPGWWLIGPYRDVSASQDNKVLDNGIVKQGAYCRWLTDDGPNPYQAPYRYNPAVDNPAPTSIKFKFDLTAVAGTSDYGREGFQIHPDGEKNGTAGCIGLQPVQACKGVQKVLRSFHGLKLRCVRE